MLSTHQREDFRVNRTPRRVLQLLASNHAKSLHGLPFIPAGRCHKRANGLLHRSAPPFGQARRTAFRTPFRTAFCQALGQTLGQTLPAPVDQTLFTGFKIDVLGKRSHTRHLALQLVG